MAHASLVDATQEFKSALWIVDCVLTGVFLLEVVLHWWSFGLESFYPTSLDKFLNLVCAVVTLVPGVLFVWILTPAGVSFLELSTAGQAMQLIMLTRFARLAGAPSSSR